MLTHVSASSWSLLQGRSWALAVLVGLREAAGIWGRTVAVLKGRGRGFLWSHLPCLRARCPFSAVHDWSPGFGRKF